jgi:cell division septation protein DedD
MWRPMRWFIETRLMAGMVSWCNWARFPTRTMPGYVETLRTPGGTKTRVRAGPYASEAAALKDRDRILDLKLASGDLRVGRKGD